MFRAALLTALRLTLVLTVLTGAVYPGIVTLIAHVGFPHQATGSLITHDGVVIGSELIGQTFTAPHYFHPRPSAAGDGYDAANSGGTNAGPLAPGLADDFRARAAVLGQPGDIPADMITASASGLDPHISPANATRQIARVATARAITEAELRRLLDRHVEPRQLQLFGEPRVNVLTLNLLLDSLHPLP